MAKIDYGAGAARQLEMRARAGCLCSVNQINEMYFEIEKVRNLWLFVYIFY